MSSWQGEDNQSTSEDHADQARRLAALRSLAERGNTASDRGALGDTQPKLARVATQMGKRGSQARRSPLQPQQGPRGRRTLQTTLIAVCIVALLGGAGAWYLKSSGRMGSGAASEPSASAVRTINLARYNYSCPMDPTWSPDGSKITVTVTPGDCSNPQNDSHLRAIFDTRTGKLTNSFPFSRLFASQNISTSIYPSPFVWTPDGTSLATAVGYDPNEILPANTKRGLLFVTLATGSTRFISDTTTTKQPSLGTTLIWDVKSGALAHTIPALQPATTYAWGADGSLSPATGETQNDAVSVWQTGTISPVLAKGWEGPGEPPLKQTLPQRFVYTSVLPHWSPDGQFLALPATMGVRLPGGADAYPLAYCPGDPLICQGAAVSPPNAGFSAILKAEQAGWALGSQLPPQVNSKDVAWRADDQELATMLPGQDFDMNASTATVTIFNARTGAIVKKLSISRVITNSSYDSGGINPPQIAWSPRGSSLAALNFADATVTLWRAE